MKKLNIVYDNWDDEGPLPNMINSTGLDKFRIVSGLFVFYGMYDRIKNCNLSEVYDNPNENFFYFVNPQGNSLYIYHQFNTVPLPSLVEKCLYECKNFNIIFLNEHEYETEEYFVLINDYCNLKNYNLEQIYLMNNNYRFKEYKEKYYSNINVYSLNFLLKFISRHLIEFNSKYVTNKQSEFFLCHNRSTKAHRYIILALMIKYDIIKEVDWSLVMGWNRILNPQGNFYEAILNQDEIESLKDEISYLETIEVKRSKYEKEYDWFKNEEISGGFNWGVVYELKTYENSYVNIVTESNFLVNEIHHTEKSIKPFYFYQFPIYLASYNHVKELKERFGFDMFDDVIDHSYDNELDNRKRLLMVFEEIKRLNSMKDDLIQFYNKNRYRFERNKQIVIDIEKSTTDIEYFNKLINKNI